VSGTGTLRIRSGFLSAMYGHYVNVSISGFDAVDFGSAEALISKQVGHGPDGGLVISSPVTGSGGLTKSGFGTLRLKGEHAYTGTTTVIDGVLEVDRASGLGLGGGEGVVLQDYGTVVAAVSFATDRPIVVRPGDSGAVSVHPGQTLTLAAGIRAGGDLAKLGTGTLVLSAPADPASASSVFVSNGTLLLENDTGSATGTGRLHVLPEATLGGNGGTLAPTMVWGNVAPGSPASVGLLSTGNMEMGRGAVLRFDLGDPAASDRISVAGDLTLDGILRIQPLDAFAPGTYRLIDYTGRLTDNGLAIFYTAPPEFAYRIDTASPGRVNLVVVPEPSALALLAAAALITRRRRR
jgi:fibronectin-binding autotransporter adhesin